jgi:hypothetical protein
MRHALLTLIICLLVFSSASAEYELVDHPRIFITKQTLPLLAERVYGSGTLADDYALMKQEADYFVERGVLKKPDSQWHAPYELVCAGICYLVERERGNENADAYAQAVIDYWTNAHSLGAGLILSNLGNGHFGYYGMVYDWIYDAMSQEERETFGLYLGSWLSFYTSQAEITLQGGDWLYNQTWGPAHLNVGNTRDGITPKLFVALALSGAGTTHEDACTQFLNSFDSRIPTECIPRFDIMGGVWSESYGHGSYGPTRVIPWAFEAWRTATGTNFFEQGEPDTFLKDLNSWALHLNVPFSNRTAYIDDNSGSEFFSSWMPTAPILASRYNDPVAAWCTEQYQRETWSTSWRPMPWQRLLFHNPDIETRTPGQVDWSVSKLFSGAGHVYMRTRWDDPNATWAFFGAGPKLANHSRDDEGHFMIARKGWLVCRAGGMGHNDWDYYSGGSMAFNTVSVFDPSEVFRRLSPSESALSNGGTKNERDGGLIRHVYGGSHADVTRRGEITAYKHDWRYTYSAADLTRGYRSSKVNEITRQFLYIRGEREFFIVFDRVDAKDEELPKTWFLHIPTEPTLNGSETELTADHVYSYSDGNYSTWLSDHAGVDEVFSTDRSRAHLTTLLPQQYTITKRGGEGHQFWGHPHEPSAQYNHAGGAATRSPVINWRLEVEAAQQVGRDYFLNVLEVTDEGVTTPSEVTLLEQGEATTGIRIVPSTGDEPIEVYFSTEGEMNGSVKFGSEEPEALPSAVDTTIQVGSRGDIDSNGQLSVADAVSMMLIGRRDPGRAICDYNQDGEFTLADIKELLGYLRMRANYPMLASENL